MSKFFCVISTLLCIMVSSCAENSNIVIGGSDDPTEIIIAENGETFMYKQITGEEAKKIMDSEEDCVILDAREQEEYDEGHIPGAILIPYTQIEEKAETMMPEKDIKILVYCRSGRRSKIAAESLARLGYTNVYEFGGIIDWKYETEK